MPVGQTTPQRPQFVVAERLASHPLEATPSQSAKPVTHAKPQAPAAHVADAFARGEHTRPHPPQPVIEVVVSTSHPVAATPSQSAKLARQVNAQAPKAQLAALAFAGTGHVVTMLVRPSALHVATAVDEAHEVEPGVHVHEVQLEPAQVDIAGQLTVMLDVPSPLHTDAVRASRQRELPGVQICVRHTPETQRSMVAQGALVALRPSALQMLRVTASAQVATPGVQLIVMHTPPRHDCPLAHSVTVLPRPSALHTLRPVVPEQLAAPGVQMRRWQVPAAHDSSAAQGVVE